MKTTTSNMTLRGVWVALILAISLSQIPMAQAQNFQVIHNFTGGQDGAYPEAGLTLDRAGNLHGTAFAGGNSGYGTIYQLKHLGSGWTFHPLYSFAGNGDGSGPVARVVFGPRWCPLRNHIQRRERVWNGLQSATCRLSLQVRALPVDRARDLCVHRITRRRGKSRLR